MKTQATTKPWWGTSTNLILPALVAVLFFGFVFSYYPFREKIQFDSDEGLNLMRSMLVTLGHPLYSEVSSDQPPLLTHLLALLFRVVGFEVNPARMLVLLFAALLVWSGAQFLQMTWGKLAAVLFVPLAVMLPEFLRLSTSVMIGLPSIALASVAMVFVVFWHRDRKELWLALSAFALALSVLIKLFTGLLAPVFLVGVTAAMYFEGSEKRPTWKILRPALVWGLCFGGLGLVLGLLLVGPSNVWSIVFPHVAAPSTDYLKDGGFTINNRLAAAVPLLLLAALGALLAIYRRSWLSLYPLAWAVLAYLSFSFYSPVFYHHQLLVTVPAAMLAAAAVGDGLSRFKMGRLPDLLRLQTALSAVAVIGFVLVSLHYWPVIDKELMDRPRLTDFTLRATGGKLKVLRTMNEHIEQTNWIMTDMPMYAFRVGKPVPPNLATFSSKRLATGALTDEDVVASLQDYRPEQVLMARFEIPSVEDYLKKNYTLILSVEYFRLFLRNDLVRASE